MIEQGNRTQYQDEIVSARGQRIMIGARQSGKTETIVQEAADNFRSNETTAIIAPQKRHIREINDRLREHFENQITEKGVIESRTGAGKIEFYSAHRFDYDEIRGGRTRTIVVDEANYVRPGLLFTIEHAFDGDVLLTATPAPEQTIVEIWAEHSPYWQMWQIQADVVPFIDNHALREYMDGIDSERELREIDAQIL